MPVSTDLPGKLDFQWYSLNYHTRTFDWPDSLAGRTFEMRRDSEDPITVDVGADTLSFTVPPVDRKNLRQTWQLVETTAADDVVWIGGTIHWGVGFDDDADDGEVIVTLGDGTPITVVGSGSVALAAEAAARIAGDAALQAGKQPLDSDLTAIAALSTTAFGRALLTLADAGAGRTAFGLGTAATHAHGDYDAAGAAAAAQAVSQPLDSDLTAIAALSTTSFGRAFLALADAAAARTAIGAQQTGLSVLLTEDQSVAGVKAFTSPPTAPDPVDVFDLTNRQSVVESVSTAGGLVGTLDEQRDALRLMELFRHDADPQYSVWRHDTGGLKAWWVSRYIGNGNHEAFEIRTVTNATTGHTVPQLRRHQIRTPLLTVGIEDVGALITFSPSPGPGVWSSIPDSGLGYGSTYRRDSTAGHYAEWTSPADAASVGYRGFVTTNGGYNLVTLDGSTTAANLCTTAQQEVDAGRLDPSALVANGGTLNPTDRLFNNYAPSDKDFFVLFANDLDPAVHTLRLTVTGYKQTESTDTRLYVVAFTYSKAGVTFGSADATPATLKKLFNQSSVWEYALSVLPDGYTTDAFIGNSHGHDQLTTFELFVDGVNVADTIANDESIDGSVVTAVRTSDLSHRDFPAIVIAHVTVVYSITTKGLEVSHEIEWLTDGIMNDSSYTAMVPGDKTLTRGRTTGGAAVDLTANDLSYKSGSKSSGALMWEGGDEGQAGVYVYLPDVGATMNSWQYLLTSDHPVSIQDRADLINKIYFQRNDIDGKEPFYAGTTWRSGFVVSAAYFDDPEEALASPVPLDDRVAALEEVVDGKQPLDSDLTAIAALSTTSYGRALLALADAAAGRTAFGLGSLATLSTVGSAQITDGSIALADQVDVAEARIRGRKSGAGTGVPQDMTAAETVAILSGTITEADVVSLRAGIDLTRTTKTFNTYRQLPVTRAGVDAFATFTPLLVAKGGKIGTVRLRTSIAASGGAGTRSKIGVYAADATTLKPTGAALYDFGAIDLTATAGTQSVASTSGTLTGTLLWLCLTLFGYTGQPTIYSEHNESWFFVESPTNVITPASGYQQAIASSALPTIDGTLAVVGGSTLIPAYQVVPAA